MWLPSSGSTTTRGSDFLDHARDLCRAPGIVAMLAWDGFNKAKAASYVEAALVLDVIQAADGLAEPAWAKMLDGMNRYTRAVIAIEWPAQAEGRVRAPVQISR